MRLQKHRVPYARVLYAAAVTALLSACAPQDSILETRATQAEEPAVVADMPEVVVTASRG